MRVRVCAAVGHFSVPAAREMELHRGVDINELLYIDFAALSHLLIGTAFFWQ
jgi:hypothetical protein